MLPGREIRVGAAELLRHFCELAVRQLSSWLIWCASWLEQLSAQS